MNADLFRIPPAFHAHEYDSQSALVPTARTGHAAYAAIALGALSKFRELNVAQRSGGRPPNSNRTGNPGQCPAARALPAELECFRIQASPRLKTEEYSHDLADLS